MFEDGQQNRDFVDVRNVPRAVLLAIKFRQGGTHMLNIGTGRRITITEVAEALASWLNLEVWLPRLRKDRAGDIRHGIADPTRAREFLCFECPDTFEQGLPALIAWCQHESARDNIEASLDQLRQKGLIR